MKKSILVLVIFPSVLFAAKKKGPITFEVNSLINSNIDRVSNPVKNDVYSQRILAKTKFKFKPIKKVILLNLPSVDIEYTPSLEEKIRNLNVNNTLIGLYLPSRNLIYNGSLNLNATKSIFTNEDQQIEDSKSWSVGLDGGVAKDINKSYNLGFNLGLKVQSFLEFSNPAEAFPLKDDNLRFNSKIIQKYKFNNSHKIALHLGLKNKIYKEKRALNSKGDQVSTLPETIYTYQINSTYDFKFKEIWINPQLGYTYNKDQVANGRTYRGFEYKLNFKYRFSKFNWSTRLSHKIRDYKTQLVDTVDTTGSSPNLEAKIVDINNTLEIPFGIKSQYMLILGHSVQALKSNRKSDDNSNEITKLGLRLKF